jgi:hypothetical protein
MKGARVLTHETYGVGPLSSLALCAWLGGADRFSSSRKAVRLVGLDITVHSSDGKRSPGRLSRQGPEVLRWLLFKAAKTSARACAPGYGYYTQVKDRYDANRACLSQARRIVRQTAHILTGLGDDAFTIVAPTRSTDNHRPLNHDADTRGEDRQSATAQGPGGGLRRRHTIDVWLMAGTGRQCALGPV